MGLAPFFERARQGAAQVLRDMDDGTFERRLGEVVVALVFDTQAATSVEGLAALDMAARLIARLYPRVRVVPLDGDRALRDELVALMRSINPHLDVVADGSGEQVAVVAGRTRYEAGTTIYMGSDRWIARVSSSGPVGCGSGAVPFGAGAAACLAVANVFRTVFADRLPTGGVDDDATLSLLNFETGAAAANADLPVGSDMGLVHLVGVGAIGNAFVWALSRLRGLSGVLHAIDPETIELSNLQRYVLPAMADVDASKVGLAGGVMADCGVETHCFATDWSGYVAGIGHHRFATVAVALDTARDRVEVQSSLPRRLVNAWTQAGDLGISRHGFEGPEACLACLYLPDGPRRNEDEIVTGELGLPEARKLDVRAMLHFGGPVGEAFASEIAAALGIDPAKLMPFAGLPLRAFRQKAICGNVILRAPDGGGADVEVPMAFQSAMAGVMLAAEVVAETTGIRAARPATRSVIDLMRRLPGRIGSAMLKRTGPVRCMCQDADHVEAYRSKYR